MADKVPDRFDFPKEEEKILELWKRLDAFQNCLKQSKDKPRYTFYDGPPFATGLPHYGHILAGTIKDIVTRYAHQSGFHVERRFGWDCHGLPVEYEIDKTLGLKTPDDVTKMGVAKYNAECRKIVMRYSEQWEEIVTRMGRWIDFKNDYKTMYPWFMESIWWVFKQMYDKGLVYRGYKVMPFSTGCHTPLSNFEAGQNYKDVSDPAVIVNFPLDEDPSVSVIAWTTTPWTLPSNLALCVHPNMNYVKVKDKSTDSVYIMMEDRLEALFKTQDEYIVLEKMTGESLEGKKYKPLFPYFESMKTNTDNTGAFRILTDTYVTAESGTGVVHQAPGFGEDDFRICLRYGIFKKGSAVICPVDPSGQFMPEVTDFAGQYVKDADKAITKLLKVNGRLVHQGTIKHSYPFCWRSETPLIYKAVPSWFVRVESLIEKLLKNNQKCYWVPEFVKDKRFHNWLKDARDWAISRNRYWGTPIPLWVSDDFEEVVCIGSIDELEKYSGVRVTDLHRENVDDITIPSIRGKGVLRRITEVFDCWFESGSMPYGQSHYPFENKKAFDANFPADFIAEGIDQTRGWFYTLLVVATALFDNPPYKNLIINGLVLASNGQKMSKRLKNYPDPVEIVNKFGADALRLYLINSPVVRAESLKFQEGGVKDVVKDVFLPWFNAYRFFMQNVTRLEKEEGVKFMSRPGFTPSNVMDCWILSFTQSLNMFVKEEMKMYRLYTVVPKLLKFIDQLTNWYVRFNRKRIKGDFGHDDCIQSLDTLFTVLYNMTLMMAPFTPFLTEHMYQSLRHYLPTNLDDSNASVHYMMIPKPRKDLVNKEIEESLSYMQRVIDLARYIRESKVLPVKYPLPEVVVVHRDPVCRKQLLSLKSYILEELNVKELSLVEDDSKYGVKLTAEPDNDRLGKRFKAEFKNISPAIKALTDKELREFQETGELSVMGHSMNREDIHLIYSVDAALSQYHAQSDGGFLVLLDITPSQEMVDEGIAREIINKIQKLRKKAGLQPSDQVDVLYKVTGSPEGEATLQRVISTHKDAIQTTTKGPLLSKTDDRSLNGLMAEEDQKMKGVSGVSLHLWILPPLSVASSSSGPAPKCRYINLEVYSKSLLYRKNFKSSLFLENPQGKNYLSFEDLQFEANLLLGIRVRRTLFLYTKSKEGIVIEVNESTDLLSLSGSTIFISDKELSCTDVVLPSVVVGPPYSPFIDIGLNGKSSSGSAWLENPVGHPIFKSKDSAKTVALKLLS
ncbi:PREDICTED: isoleucine--tRNA ligase, cytoplasmic [Amphimedon queenslandica]|uniref:Isoleucine--tRNA ligase, cytoplasmic n=1 Tax=Amphimedon queenslandica TaxID=400682 RepID=A0A1X7V5F0_AMPQE|nr:PREDICTED: isoleucine--tRNA ligase, cytoplasmic [Amphimedon queenslandica]|eukprot:XP_003385671.1 PREDICTED: isoleucine--tRNA ligase, cytoplasmic [Amphimedon queenslandica]